MTLAKTPAAGPMSLATDMRSTDGKKRLCDTVIFGVVATSRGLELSERRQSVGACPPFQWDDHVFAFFVGR
jgi:hypothetical protein